MPPHFGCAVSRESLRFSFYVLAYSGLGGRGCIRGVCTGRTAPRRIPCLFGLVPEGRQTFRIDPSARVVGLSAELRFCSCERCASDISNFGIDVRIRCNEVGAKSGAFEPRERSALPSHPRHPDSPRAAAQIRSLLSRVAQASSPTSSRSKSSAHRRRVNEQTKFDTKMGRIPNLKKLQLKRISVGESFHTINI